MARKVNRSRRLLVILVTSLVIAAAIAVAIQPTEPTPPRPADAPDQTRSRAALLPRPVTLFRGIHLLGGLQPAAAYVVETSVGLVLIDSGLEADGALVRRQLRDLGLDATRLRKILLTHGHGDHVLGAMHFRRATGAQIYAGRCDCGPLRAGGPPRALFSTFDMRDVSVHRTEVDVELAGGELIACGDEQITAIATPGHTPGSTCYLLERDGKRILFTGDTIMSIADGLGTYVAHLAPSYRGSAEDFLASFEKLRALPPPDLLLPGHPRADASAQSPWVTPGQWQRLLERGTEEMEVLLGRFEADGRDFLNGEPKEILPGLFYLGDHEGVALYCVREGDTAMLVNAPGGPALLELLRERFARLGWQPENVQSVLLTSAAPEASAGVAALVERFHSRVVAAASAQEALASYGLKSETLELIQDTLPLPHGFDGEAIPLKGCTPGAIAYRIHLNGKTVLLSGSFPLHPSLKQADAWSRNLPDAATQHRNDFLKALDRLSGLRPDVWLPSHPIDDQNANLYDADWSDTITANRVFLKRISTQP